jgi:hypothetical protein
MYYMIIEELPLNKNVSIHLTGQVARYYITDNILYRRSVPPQLIKCLSLEESTCGLKEIHEGTCGLDLEPSLRRPHKQVLLANYTP